MQRPYSTLKQRLLDSHKLLEPELLSHMRKICSKGEERNRFFIFLQQLPKELWSTWMTRKRALSSWPSRQTTGRLCTPMTSIWSSPWGHWGPSWPYHCRHPPAQHGQGLWWKTPTVPESRSNRGCWGGLTLNFLVKVLTVTRSWPSHPQAFVNITGTLTTMPGTATSLLPGKLTLQVSRPSQPQLEKVKKSCTVGCLLTRDGDDNGYFFTGNFSMGLKYLEHISSMRRMNHNLTMMSIIGNNQH